MILAVGGGVGGGGQAGSHDIFKGAVCFFIFACRGVRSLIEVVVYSRMPLAGRDARSLDELFVSHWRWQVRVSDLEMCRMLDLSIGG